MIFQVIRESSGGFPRVNQGVKKELRSWYFDKLKGLIKVEPEGASLFMLCVGVVRGCGYDGEALTRRSSAIKLFTGIHGDEHPLVAHSYNNMALACRGKGQRLSFTTNH